MSTTAAYEDLLEACRQDGCPVCRLEHAADWRYLDRLFYEQVNDLGVRQQLRASRGFCLEHARMATEEMQGKALGLAIIYDDQLRLGLEDLAAGRLGSAALKKCPACANREETTLRVFAELSKNLLQPALLDAFRASQGLCFGHLRQALEHLRSPEKRAALVTAQSAIMEKLRAELAEYIRKNDYRFAGESFGAERDAWRRAVLMGKKA
jgi:hypothetical protein